MKAVLMAGGEGTRLRPLTSNQPKPMVNIFNKPVMEYIIELLKSHGITDIIVTLQFLPQVIKNFYGDGSDLGVNISYAIEEEPLGTAGSVKNAEQHINETFIVISGDALTDFDLKKAISFHEKRKSVATIVLKSVKNPLEYGVVITNEKGKIERFLEKPSWGQVFSDTVNTGLYILEPEVLKHIPEKTRHDFSKDLFPKLLKEKYLLYGYVAEGYWCDIGGLAQYNEVHEHILDGKVKVEPEGIKMRNKVWVGQDCVIDPDAKLEGPAFIGQHSKIEAGAKVKPGSVIGNNVVVKSNAVVNKAIIQENAFIGAGTILNKCVISKNCDIKKGSRIEQGVVIGDDCKVGENATINHSVKIYPFKSIDAGATINRSLIWETRGMRTLFGVSHISGIVNVDINPELITRIAIAYGTSLPKDSVVVTSRDSSKVARVMKRSIVAGLTATGIHVRDLRISPKPVNRFTIKSSRCAGGVHIGVSPFDPQMINIDFFDKDGIDLNSGGHRNIEKYFYREDFRRAFYNEFGDIIFPSRTGEYYTNGLVSSINQDVIKKKKPKVIIDYSYGSASFILPFVLGQLGIDAITLNAFSDEARAALTHIDLDKNVEKLSETVKVFKADLGILIDNSCEKLIVIDNKGNQIGYNDLVILLIQLTCQFEKQKGALALPISVSGEAEKIAKIYKRKIIRTRVSASDLMEKSLSKNVVFAGDREGRFIYPKFIPAFDAVMTFCKLLEFISLAKQPLNKLVSLIPKTNVLETQTLCSWDNKGLVMRSIIENNRKNDVDLVDGIKIYDKNGWTLVLPDQEEPIITIIAEGENKKNTRLKLKNMQAKIDKIINGNE